MPDVREELCRYGKKIVDGRLVAGAGGNVSGRDGDIIWMKPSGFAMDEMAPENMCGMDLATGEQKLGNGRPTSEVNMHLAIYRERPEICCVFHCHSAWASGVISAGVVMKPMFAEFVNDLGRLGTVPYITPTTQALADAMGEVAKTADTIFMVNHGVLAVGMTMNQALYRLLVVEDAAKSLVAATVVGTPRFITQEQADELLSLDAVQHRTKMAEGGM